ncbi:hypothetical protein [Microbacterium elymi]|uniref:DUF4190 domain-containing protein n=1 Tax=Microbacterium elymi TaxID=2909587 RepID=A0ABY5NHZ1_9MICO|nr:hypothetical protein [Microbacterium elymi]UUT34797.1 hypothetical protein L2X98_30575 [Microbacterium elymi]
MLASKAQGGKGFGIAGLIVSIVGGVVFAIALTVSLLWIGLAANSSLSDSSSGSVPSAQASDDATDSETTDGTDGAAGTYDEAAYVEDVRPKIRDLVTQIQPGATDDQIDQLYADDTLVLIGTAMLQAYDALGEDAISTEAQSMVDSSQGAVTEEQAEQFMHAVLESAQQYLVKSQAHTGSSAV